MNIAYKNVTKAFHRTVEQIKAEENETANKGDNKE